MTAIVVVHTADGFVIGADGRRFDSVTGTFKTDNAKKVFLIESEKIRLANAWTASTQASDTNGLVYDLLAASEEMLPLVVKSDSHNFASFISAFCSALATKLPRQMTNMPKEELARGVFAGYFQGQPFSAHIQVLYPLTFLMVLPEVHFPVQYHKAIFSGAESIFSSKYADWNPQSGTEASKFVEEYIRDCSDSSNPDCAGIGGHIHIAELKPKQWQWIIAPVD